MSNQLFKSDIPPQLLFNLLEKVCLKTDNYYLFDINAYKKIIFHGYEKEFCEHMKDFYHYGKQFYVTRQMTYKSFTNILRQICKNASIMHTSQMKYNESKYNIIFYIYF